MKRKSKGNALSEWKNYWGKASPHEEYTELVEKLASTEGLTRGEWYRYSHLYRQLHK